MKINQKGKFPNFQISKFPNFQISKFPNFCRNYLLKLQILGVFLGLLLLNSCKKNEIIEIKEDSFSQNRLSTNESTSSIEQMSHTINQISEVGSIIKEVVKEEACLKEILALIHSGYYLDEQVFLYDLIYSQESRLFKSKLSTEKKLESSRFKARYLNVLSNIHGSKSDIRNYDKNITIYFPYSENFKERLEESITFVFCK